MPTKPADDGLYRLRDIRVEEVSLVDRPANQRKFLVVKRNEKAMPTGAEVVTGANGALTAGGGAVAAPAAASGAPAAPTPELAKATVSMTSDMKTALADTLSAALDGLGAAKDMVDGATEVGDVGQADVSPLVASIAETAEILLDTLEGLDAFLSNAQGAPAEGEAPANAPDGQGKSLAAKSVKGKATLAKALEFARATGIVRRAEIVQKYGAKMSAARLATFGDAMKTLNSLMEELAKAPPPPPPAAAAAKPGEDPKDPKKKKPGAPGAPAPGAPAAAAAPPAPPAKKSEEQEASAKVIAKLQAELIEATTQLEKVRKNRATSNALPQDGAGSGETGGSFSWPLGDMNTPVTSDRKEWFGR